MAFSDERDAAHHLTHIGYYRLTSYWLPYEADHASHAFKDGTRFEDVIRHYSFDRDLRLLLMDAIERVEIAVRTRWVFVMVEAHGTHAHLDPTLFATKSGKNGTSIWDHSKGCADLRKEHDRSQETWVKHFRSKYDEPLPPLWASCELMTLGAFSKWYKYTAQSGLRNKVARSFGIDEAVLASFLHHISVVRNICAHHARLWNRNFTLILTLPKRPGTLGSSLNTNDVRKIYNTLTMLAFLLDSICPSSSWRRRVLECMARYEIDPTQMGFPANYRETVIWKIVGIMPT